MIAAAREVVVVADSSKFEHRALAPVCGLEEVDLILTDDGLDPEIRKLYGERLECVALDAEYPDAGAILTESWPRFACRGISRTAPAHRERP